jgi:hypothetical protein
MSDAYVPPEPVELDTVRERTQKARARVHLAALKARLEATKETTDADE